MVFKNYRLIKVFLLFIFCVQTVFAQVPKNIDAFKKLPRSIAKDYYIYRYLNEKNISSAEAQKLFIQSKTVNLKLFYSFAKKMENAEFKKASKCLRLKRAQLLKEDSECIAIGLSIYDIFSLDKSVLKKLKRDLVEYKDIEEILDIATSRDIFHSALKDKKQFIKIFNQVGQINRKKIFNRSISKKDIDQLSNIYEFNKSIEIILTQRELKKLQKSLLNIDLNSNLTSKSFFFLGLNALEFNKKELALKYFSKAYDKAYYRFDKDKILFWEYQTNKDEKFLKILKSSFDINIYTIFANEKYCTKFNNIISPQIHNKKIDYDIENPFLWEKLLRKIKDKNSTILERISKKFKHSNTIGQYTFIKERAEKYKMHYFPMPFYDLLKNYKKKRASLILALARQESRFIPASISTSYALGMMQFMPFLARAIAKQKKIKNFDLDDMFNPKIAYSFANYHLNYLENRLHNPLFIAYAYNGGIGYVRRLLKSGIFFKKGEYEPYLSMELISYPESRRYGKKVLANYIIYMQLLGKKVTLSKLVANM